MWVDCWVGTMLRGCWYRLRKLRNHHHNKLWVDKMWVECWVGTMLRGPSPSAPSTPPPRFGGHLSHDSYMLPDNVPVIKCLSTQNLLWWWLLSFLNLDQHPLNIVPTQHSTHILSTQNLLFLSLLNLYQHPLNIVPTQHFINIVPTHNLFWWLAFWHI